MEGALEGWGRKKGSSFNKKGASPPASALCLIPKRLRLEIDRQLATKGLWQHSILAIDWQLVEEA